MKHTLTRVIATLLCVMLVVSMLSVAASAANAYDESVDDYFSVVSKQDWDLAPGVTESEIVLNNATGSRRQVIHVVEADISNPYTSVMTSYTNIQPETYITPDKYDVSGMSNHAAAIEQNFGYNVVAGMNCCLSWYNSADYINDPSRVNEPLGVMVVDGYTMFDHSVGFPTCLVINKDERPEGMAKVEMKAITSADQLTGYEEQVIPTSSGFILQDGVVVPSENHEEAASRSVVGIKPDGTVIALMNDGRQAPFSVGMSTYELATTMKSLGCSYAVNCDGGGSSTFLSQRPGEELKVNGTLSEGVERANTSGIMFISSAPASGEFEVAHVTAENDIVTPNSTVQFSVLGTDLTGAEVEIPAEAQWALADDSYGTIDQNGLFTSTGKTGEVTAQITMPDVTDRTVVFTNNKGLNDVRIYCWNEETGEVGASWPGTAMTQYGVNEYNQPRFRYELPASADKFIISGTYADNPDARWQTDNMDAGQVGVYIDDADGWPAKTFDISGLTKAVGEATITVAVPERIAFQMENITVPFGKSVSLDVNAYLGAKIVTLKDGDIQFSLSDNAIGTISGNTFTAPAESEVTEATVTATFTGTEISAAANLTLGRGSEVVLDFEDGNPDLFSCADMHGCHNQCSTYLVDSTTGKVHSGNYAQAMHVDFSETMDWGGVQGTNFFYLGDELDHTGCTAIGFWMYIPEEAVGIYPAYRASVTDANGKSVTFMPDDETKGFSGSCVEESGWQYITIDMTKFAGDTIKNRSTYTMIQFYLQYVFDKPYDKSINTDVTFYLDDVTIDYSSAVDDREEPVFGTVSCVADDIAGTTVAMPRYETPSIDAGTVSFSAAVAEDTTKSNYTGLNTASAQAFVDGVEVDCNYVGGTIYTQNMTLAAGVHTAKFYMSDAMGNKACVVRKININANSDAPTIELVPQDSTIEKALIGSLYYLDVKANKIEDVAAVDMVVDLNNVNDWELQGMEVADGFTATYDVDEVEHVATLHFESDGTLNAAGEYVIASLPVRVWWCESFTYGNKTAEATGNSTWTARNYWSTKTLWPMDIKVDVDCGVLTLTNGETSTFSGDQIVTDTEVYYSRLTTAGSTGIALFDLADWSSKTRWHQHDAQPAPDLAPTCDKPGYTGRTFCEECNSVIDWGTEVPATNHNLTTQPDGLYVCPDCGEVFYLENGVPQSGSYFVDGKMYTFDDDGNYLPNYRYDGFYEIDDTVMFFNSGVYLTGYQSLNNRFYWFDENGFGLDGVVEVCGQDCTFDDGLFVPDSTVLFAGSCGENVAFVVYQNGDMVVDGNGAMTEYTNVGLVPWRVTCDTAVKTLTIGKGVTSIGNLAFRNLPNLATVTFEAGSKLENISHTGFAYNKSLTEIYLPEGIKTVRSAAFYNCYNLEFVYLPSSLTLVDRDAFNGCSKLTASVVLNTAAFRMVRDAGIDYVLRVEELASGTSGDTEWWINSDGTLYIDGDGAMADYSSAEAPFKNYANQITSVVIGSDVTAIGQFALYGLKKVTYVGFEPDSKLETIGWGAFGQMSALTEITIPASVTEIKAYAFYYDTALATVNFEEDSALTTIGKQAFWKDAALEYVFIPDNVSSIGNDAFLEADNGVFSVARNSYAHKYFAGKNLDIRDVPTVNLYEGTIGDVNWAVTNDGKLIISGEGDMPDYAVQEAPWFQYSKLIDTIEIGNEITSIGQFCFYGLKNITSVVFEADSSIETIGWGAFGQESKLTEITIPASVVEIKAYAFYYDTALTAVYFEEDSELTTIGKLAFWHDANLEFVYIPDFVSSIGSEAFLDADYGTFSVVRNSYAAKYFAGKDLDLRDAPAYNIYEGAVNDTVDWAITSEGKLVISGEGAMEDYAVQQAPWFQYSKLIDTVVIGNEITYTGQFAFYGLKNVTAVEFEADSKLETIGWGSFGQESKLAEITLPASVVEIKAYAFYYDTALEWVDFEDDSALTTIGKLAFWKDAALEYVFIPDGVTSIGKEAFLEADNGTFDVLGGSYAETYFAGKDVAIR